jgi:5-methyltetrahydropteroyltriglutamate--homocysteine methyltransferase
VTGSPVAHRADQVGSFLRPPELLHARAEHAGGHLAAQALREAEDAAIQHLLEQQQACGLDIFTDGEFRRASFLGDFTAAVEGFEQVSATVDFFASQSGSPRPTLAVTRRLQQRTRLALAEAAFLRQHVPGGFNFKIALPTPFQFTNFVPGITDRVYGSRQELLSELAQIVAKEVRALFEEGVRYVQIDAPRYSYFIDPRLANRFRAGGVDPGLTLDEVLEADNAVLSVPRPSGTISALHMCRGNARSTWYAEGGYDAIAEQLFSQLSADRFLLEYDDARSGSFEPLRFVPPGKVVVLGLVTTKSDILETQAELLPRIDAAARFIPLEQLALSPQCGFASLVDGNKISPDTQWRKLELVVETARRVWG